METKTHIFHGWRLCALFITVLMAAAGYLFFTIWGGWQEVLEASYQVGVKGVLTCLCLSFLNYILRFIRWQHYLHNLGAYVPWVRSFRIYLAGFALTTTPAKSGETLRSVFLKDEGVSYHTSFGAFLSERLSDLIAVLIVAATGLWLYPSARLLLFTVALVIAAILYTIQQRAWLNSIALWARRKLSRRFSDTVRFLVRTMLAFRSCFTFTALMYGILLGTLAWSAEGLAFYTILHLLKTHIPLLTALFIYGFSMLVGAISFLPGGLGGFELTMLQLLLWHGVSSADAVAATIVIRLVTLWFAVLVGLIALPYRRLLLQK
jgi:uncharacterized protein (TIRG00374 family)